MLLCKDPNDIEDEKENSSSARFIFTNPNESLMQLNEVPQDGLHLKDRDQLRKLVYAVDSKGHYQGIPSKGWDAENAATQGAWEEVEAELKETEQAIREGRLSPLAYFMKKCLMDVPLLARYAGKWGWTVRRHMKPKHFAKLSTKTLENYARIFEITVEELTSFGKTPH